MIPGLNQEQCKQLLQFISNLAGNANTKSMDVSASACHMAGIYHALNVVHSFYAVSHDTWILDYGASEHMSSKQDFLHDLSRLTCPIMVDMPNGIRVKGPSMKRPSAIGKDQVGLYVLNKGAKQTWNLQEGHQDIQDNGASSVGIEGTGKVDMSRCNKLAWGVTFDVWHRRLGHMSDAKTKLISDVDVLSNKDKMLICDGHMDTSHGDQK